ncbi:HAD family phosphatase [Nonomuraea sp. NPDC046802]|uniref:HAD family hydrolase n=1 Tax=Nonomuraea sp. NPDC046802 TaxID=3154919 RepID=UPI0033F4BCF6
MTWIVFDYGGVLSLPQAESDADDMALAVDADREAFKRIYWERRLDFDRGDLTPLAYWSEVTGRPVTPTELARLVAMDVASWANPDEGTVALLGELIEDGRDVALLSNAPACIGDGIDELPWIAAIGHRFYSARMGLVKPDRKIYDEMARALDADPAQIVFIDDRQENVEGAQRAGMTGVRFTGAAALRAALSDIEG